MVEGVYNEAHSSPPGMGEGGHAAHTALRVWEREDMQHIQPPWVGGGGKDMQHIQPPWVWWVVNMQHIQPPWVW